MDLREIGLGGGVDSTGSGWGSLAACCECGDEPSGSGATELVFNNHFNQPEAQIKIITSNGTINP
jgi:hypothetical protein